MGALLFETGLLECFVYKLQTTDPPRMGGGGLGKKGGKKKKKKLKLQLEAKTDKSGEVGRGVWHIWWVCLVLRACAGLGGFFFLSFLWGGKKNKARVCGFVPKEPGLGCLYSGGRTALLRGSPRPTPGLPVRDYRV